MPVRSLTSSAPRWPEYEEVDAAVREWARVQVETHDSLISLGYFGSYAREESGVGSDLDLVAVVHSSSQPFDRRALDWDLSDLPVPAEILIYTRAEWEQLSAQGTRFARTLDEETVWVLKRP